MNYLSRTYGGSHKFTTFLFFFAQLLALLRLVPHVVGRQTGGLSVAGGIRCLILFVNVGQAVRYQSVKSSDEEDGA